MRRKPKPDVIADTQALDRRAYQIWHQVHANGKQIDWLECYQQAMREMDAAKAEKAGGDELFVGQ